MRAARMSKTNFSGSIQRHRTQVKMNSRKRLTATKVNNLKMSQYHTTIQNHTMMANSNITIQLKDLTLTPAMKMTMSPSNVKN
jgi:hypothetical protein